jgi:hypothetical protein
VIEARAKQLEKQAREDFRHRESLFARLEPFVRKEAVRMEATNVASKKEWLRKRQWSRRRPRRRQLTRR